MKIPEHIKFLIAKRKKGRLTETDKAELDAWYNEPLPAEIEMEGEEDSIRQSIFRRIDRELGDEGQVKVRRFPSWTRVAAVVSLMLVSISILYYYNGYSLQGESEQLVENRQGVRKIILPDSSIVWLKAESRFSYPKQFGRFDREVVLEGEALFEIAGDKQRPFIVRSGHYLTKVLGTSFNIRTGRVPEDFDLSVLTGKVQVERKEKRMGANTFLVSANQSFRAEVGKVEELHSVAEKEKVQAIIQGTQYDMAFVKTPFEVIMQRFEQKFDVKFEGYTGEYASCRITADLTDQPLDKSLHILCLAINASYKIDNNKIKLTGGGCF